MAPEEHARIHKLELIIADLIEGETAVEGTPMWHALRNARAALDGSGAPEEWTELERLKAENARLRWHAERLLWCIEGGRRPPHYAGSPDSSEVRAAYRRDVPECAWDARQLRRSAPAVDELDPTNGDPS